MCWRPEAHLCRVSMWKWLPGEPREAGLRSLVTRHVMHDQQCKHHLGAHQKCRHTEFKFVFKQDCWGMYVHIRAWEALLWALLLGNLSRDAQTNSAQRKRAGLQHWNTPHWPWTRLFRNSRMPFSNFLDVVSANVSKQPKGGWGPPKYNWGISPYP